MCLCYHFSTSGVSQEGNTSCTCNLYVTWEISHLSDLFPFCLSCSQKEKNIQTPSLALLLICSGDNLLLSSLSPNLASGKGPGDCFPRALNSPFKKEPNIVEPCMSISISCQEKSGSCAEGHPKVMLWWQSVGRDAQCSRRNTSYTHRMACGLMGTDCFLYLYS